MRKLFVVLGVVALVACRRSSDANAPPPPHPVDSVGRTLSDGPVAHVSRGPVAPVLRNVADAAVAEPTATGGGPAAALTLDEARDHLANLRCRMRERCETDLEFDACVTDLRADLATWAQGCKAIDELRFQTCLAAITEQACTPGTPEVCAAESVCR